MISAYAVLYSKILLLIQENKPKKKKSKLKKQKVYHLLAKKSAAPKEKKKDAKKKESEDLEKAERELAEKETKEKEEAERKTKAEWDILDEETKFIKTKENKYKEPFISIGTKQQLISKIGDKLAEFEECINCEGGLWIEFSKSPPVDPEDTKKKAAKAKKGAVEAEKPIKGRAWVDFTKLKMPGGNEISQRCFFVTLASEEAQKGIFETSRTYVSINIKLSKAITSEVYESPKLELLIPKKPAPPKYQIPKDCMDEFDLQIQLAIEALAKQYIKFAGPIEESSDFQLSNLQEEEKRRLNKSKFLHDLNTSGKFQVFKEKLKRTVVRIVKEKYAIKEPLKGVTFSEKDKVFSDLYMTMVEQLRVTVSMMVSRNKDALHYNVISTNETECKRILQISTSNITESSIGRLLRLSKEYTLRKDWAVVDRYYMEAIKLNERDLKVWLKYFHFAYITGNYLKAVEALKECLAIEPENIEFIFLYSAVLLTQNKFKEASVYLLKVTDTDKYHINANLLLSILSETEGSKDLSEKYMSVAKRKKMRELSILGNIGKLKESTYSPSRALAPEEFDRLFLDLSSFLLKHKLFDTAEKVLSHIQKKDTLEYLMLFSLIKYRSGDFKDALETVEKVIKIKANHAEALELKGHILYDMNDYDNASEVFLKAIRIKPQGKHFSLFLKLGTIYIKKQFWKDACVVFYNACKHTNTSYAWQYLGYAHMMLSELKESEECLSRANVLDNKNADIWAILSLLSLKNGNRQTQASQCMREAIKLGFSNTDILNDIIHTLLDLNNKEKALELIDLIYDKIKDNSEFISKYRDLCTKSDSSPIIQVKKEIQNVSMEDILKPEIPTIRKSKVIGTFISGVNPDCLKYIDGIMYELSRIGIEECIKQVESVKAIKKECISILKFQSIRVEKIKGHYVQLEKGKQMQINFNVTHEEGDSSKIECIMPDYGRLLEKGCLIYLMSGNIQCKVVSSDKNSIIVDILNSGVLYENTSVLIPSLHQSQLSASEKEIVCQKCNSFDYICMNIESKDDIDDIREIYEGGLIAQIYNKQGLQQIESILPYVDGILLDRMSLVTQLPFGKIASVEQEIIEFGKATHKPILIGTTYCEGAIESFTSSDLLDLSQTINSQPDGMTISMDMMKPNACQLFSNMDSVIQQSESMAPIRDLKFLTGNNAKVLNTMMASV